MTAQQPNALDKCWEELDAMLYELMHNYPEGEREGTAVSGECLGLATAISFFYSKDVDWVREQAMSRYHTNRARRANERAQS